MRRLARRPISPGASRLRECLAAPLADRLGALLSEEGRDSAEAAAAAALIARMAAMSLLLGPMQPQSREQFLALQTRRILADREDCQALVDHLTARHRPDRAMWLLACVLVDLTDGLLRYQRDQERRADPFGEE